MNPTFLKISDNIAKGELTRVRLTKIEELPNAEVPNNKPVGTVREGSCSAVPEVGKQFCVARSMSGVFLTSEVVEIHDEESCIMTHNSLYKIELL